MSGGRPLTEAERALARSVFGAALALDPVRIVNRRWAFFQPRNVVMAPRGAIHFHPAGGGYHDCFGAAGVAEQGLLVHELTHVWQHQQGIDLVLRRHPFCRYDYAVRPGWPLRRYGLEQQAEIVRHVFLLDRGVAVPGAPPVAQLRSILPF